jgi:NAD(P)-dependent dehydrogenase (short-subunit alcohol dehydrogenase family)
MVSSTLEPNAIGYSASKGVIVSFTRTIALSLAEQGIRVNAVAPGPAWTPLTVSSYPPEKVAVWGTDIPMERRHNHSKLLRLMYI